MRDQPPVATNIRLEHKALGRSGESDLWSHSVECWITHLKQEHDVDVCAVGDAWPINTDRLVQHWGEVAERLLQGLSARILYGSFAETTGSRLAICLSVFELCNIGEGTFELWDISGANYEIDQEAFSEEWLMETVRNWEFNTEKSEEPWILAPESVVRKFALRLREMASENAGD